MEPKKKEKYFQSYKLFFAFIKPNNFTILLVSNHAMCKSWIIFFFILYIIRIIKKCYQRNVVINYSSLIDQCVV